MTKTKKKKIYIGVDPDLRVLNAAIIDDDKKLHAVFVRRNKTGPGPIAVCNAARMACRLIEDVIAFLVATPELGQHEIHLVVEDQNLQYTGKTNRATLGKLTQLCQVTGCLMGAFSNMTHEIHLVQPINWKGNVPKGIHHLRIYKDLGLECTPAGAVNDPTQGYCVPNCLPEIVTWSHDKVNPGDFKDISDSIGLAAYGIKKGY